MRKITDEQMKLGEVDISRIEFDLRSRDEIPKLLMGFQHIYTTPELRTKIFKILEEMIPPDVDTGNGRPGMELWRILVLGALRLNCNWDYDKLQEITNNHARIRAMLGIGPLEQLQFRLATLKDNVSLLTPDVLKRVNEVVVGHMHAQKKTALELRTSCDSFVVETNVHYPTDVNLLNDALRKVIVLTARLCRLRGIEGWRQARHLTLKIRRMMHRVQNVKRAGGRDARKKDKEVRRSHRQFIAEARRIIGRSKASVKRLRGQRLLSAVRKKLDLLAEFTTDAQRQIDQIRSRVLQGTPVPHTEKVFSIFEKHTEWVVKGKAGVPVELGLKVCLIRDQFGCILNHTVMEKLQDVDVAVPFTRETKKKFPALKSCSYDKGFYSPENRAQLRDLLGPDCVIMPKKGKLNEAEQKTEQSEDFRRGRKSHASVESSISALENHGLDLCRDKGIAGFKRYVALAVLARNVQIRGHMLQRKRLAALIRRERREALRRLLAA